MAATESGLSFAFSPQLPRQMPYGKNQCARKQLENDRYPKRRVVGTRMKQEGARVSKAFILYMEKT